MIEGAEKNNSYQLSPLLASSFTHVIRRSKKKATKVVMYVFKLMRVCIVVYCVVYCVFHRNRSCHHQHPKLLPSIIIIIIIILQ